MAGVRRLVPWLAWGLVLLVWTGALRLSQYLHEPVGEGTYRIRVAAGSGPLAVARRLEAAGLGDWAAGTRLGLRLFWAGAGTPKAGAYTFRGPLRLVDVFRDLEKGRVDQVTLTIPEGTGVREMARLLEGAEVAEGKAFLSVALSPESARRWDLPGPTLEGYLFPDTYRFAQGVAPEAVVDAMVRRFRQVVAPHAAEADAQGLSLREWTTLASVVEKETGASAERPLIAAVFRNRLARGMRLESDPTVIYGTEGFDGNLRRADLVRDGPYNTYTRRGLPPGPIANPGLASLLAVLRPAAVPYLYFVSRNDGTHTFSQTFEEHTRKVNRYQRRGKP